MREDTYIEYLEAVILSVLDERDSDDPIASTSEHPCFYNSIFLPKLIRDTINDERKR